MTIDQAAGPDAPARALTGAEAYFEQKLKDPEYAAAYREASIRLAKTLRATATPSAPAASATGGYGQDAMRPRSLDRLA